MSKKNSKPKKSTPKKAKAPQPKLPSNLQVLSLGGYGIIVLKEMFFKIVATRQLVDEGILVLDPPREMLIAHDSIKLIGHLGDNRFQLITTDNTAYDFELSDGAKLSKLKKQINAKG